MLFQNRVDAGKQLAVALAHLAKWDCVVLALPRGGVPVAAQVAAALGAPLDIILVRKIGAPRQPEFAIGSVVDGGDPIVVRDQELMRLSGTSEMEFDRICAQELAEIERRRHLYLGARGPVSLQGRTVIVVDDGLATGNMMRAALRAVRLRGPACLVMAIPVAPREALDSFRAEVDEIICLAAPRPFGAVGHYYEDFSQTGDEEVIALLARFGPAVRQGGNSGRARYGHG